MIVFVFVCLLFFLRLCVFGCVCDCVCVCVFVVLFAVVCFWLRLWLCVCNCVLRCGGEHWARMVVVEVRQGTLARMSWLRSGGLGADGPS